VADQPHLTFGDNVRVRHTPETERVGLAGLTGSISGLTTPSVTAVRVHGEPTEDFALAVMFDDPAIERAWFSEDLLEFIDHAPGTTIWIKGAPTKAVRAHDGRWIDVPVATVEQEPALLKVLRVLLAGISAVASIALAIAVASLLANHLFEWSPDKVSLEWPTTVYFSWVYGVMALGCGGVAALSLRGRSRTVFLWSLGLFVAAVWLLLVVKFWRVNPGYLWLLVPLPVIFGYIGVRARQRFRKSTAG
jgi:hypothetical protein